MTIKVFPSSVNGTLRAPASKSVMQRVLAGALLHKGTTEIINPGFSNDDNAALELINALGASSSYHNEVLVISSPGFHKGSVTNQLSVSCGESGLAARMFAPIVAMANASLTLTAQGSLQQRSMVLLETLLPPLGVEIKTTQGKFPIRIRGPLTPRDMRMDGSLSSQFLTGLLFAFGATATEPFTISVDGLKSKPYIDLTIKIMADFGMVVSQNKYTQFTVYPRVQKQELIRLTVEGDWSNAAFLLVAGAIAGRTELSGLQMDSLQADRAIMEVLKACGAGVEINNESIIVHKERMSAFHFDATDCPDLFPPLVALASYCNGRSVIKGVSRLAGKESDRAKTLQNIFSKMGIKICFENDDMIIIGGIINSAAVTSHNDHRIAMAAAVAALGGSGPVIIENAEAINKSYPSFYRDLEILGATTEGYDT